MGRHVRAKNTPFPRSAQSSLAALDPFNRAQEARSAKNVPAAIALFRQAIAQRPDHFQAHLQLGLALIDQGDLVNALDVMQRTSALQPHSLQPRLHAADLLRGLRRFQEAIVACGHILHDDPKCAEAYVVRGTTRREIGDVDGAIDDLQTATQLRRNAPLPFKTLGSLLQERGLHLMAKTNLEKARRLTPDDAELLQMLGNVYTNIGDLRQAFIDYRRSIELQPYDATTHANLCGLLCLTGQVELAASVGELAIKLKPDLFVAHANLATAYEAQGKNEQAVVAYGAALHCSPNEGRMLMSMCRLLRQDSEWQGLAVSEALAQALTYKKGNAISPFGILNVTSSLADILLAGRLWAAEQTKTCGAPLARYEPRPEARRSEKLRIGYLSADFHVHATAALIAEVFELHDKSRFEIFGYSIGGQDDSPMRRRLVAALDHFVDLNTFSHTDAAARIRADEIDILVDLKGYTFQARPGILGWRPAPIQVNYLGYPGTMGASFMDYILADPIVAPMEHQRFYSEKIVHLPDCYQPNDRRRSISVHAPTRADCGLPDEGFVFCCFNAIHKIHESFFTIWMRLLKATPNSVLWLLAANQRVVANLRREADKHGIDPDRLVFAPKLTVSDHLARMRHGDLFLDTAPYGAHTTASEALWTGLPIVTCLGEAFASRVGASLLGAVGLSELVTYSLEGYEALALRLARDKDEMARIRAKLAGNLPNAPLFDAPRITQHIETAFARMAEIRDAGEAPASFCVESP